MKIYKYANLTLPEIYNLEDVGWNLERIGDRLSPEKERTLCGEYFYEQPLGFVSVDAVIEDIETHRDMCSPDMYEYLIVRFADIVIGTDLDGNTEERFGDFIRIPYKFGVMTKEVETTGKLSETYRKKASMSAVLLSQRPKEMEP